MQTPLILLIVLLSIVICALAGYWFYRAAEERRHRAEPPFAPQITRHSGRNRAWDHAVRSARNRNW
jgi:uncharacterized protein YneF (UPF0154 family)